jgi:hypothetical protein
MKLVFTKSKLPLSVLIRKVLSEPVSHFAIVFEPDLLLFQSNLLGTNLNFYPRFTDHCTVVYVINIPMSQQIEDKVYMTAMEKYADQGYGFKELFYFTWRAVLHSYFGRPWPKKNIMDESNDYLCVGLAQALDCDGVPLWVRQVIQGISDLEMTTPYALYNLLLDAQKKVTIDAAL